MLDLWLCPTDLNINRDHQGLSTYQVWSFWGKAFLKYQLHKVCAINKVWETDKTFDLVTYWPEYQQRSLLIKDYLVSTYQDSSFWGKTFWNHPLHKVRMTDRTFDLDLWPTNLTIYNDHLLIKDYLPIKFEASGQSVLELSVAQGMGDQHDLWP